jgi:hypothetical protein
MISSCMDSPSEINGKRVEFKIPDFDIDIPDIINKLKERKSGEQYKLGIRQVQHSDQNDPLNAWYHPTIPAAVHVKHRQELDQIISSSEKLTLDHLRRIVSK